jgi:hypothetical protein
VTPLIIAEIARIEGLPVPAWAPATQKILHNFQLFSGKEKLTLVQFRYTSKDSQQLRPYISVGSFSPIYQTWRAGGADIPTYTTALPSSGPLAWAVGCWITYGEVISSAIDHFPRAAGILREIRMISPSDDADEMRLASPEEAAAVAQRAVQMALCDPAIEKRLEEKKSQIQRCTLPTEYGYANSSRSEVVCGALKYDPLKLSATWNGAPYVSSDGSLGRSFTVAISSRGSTETTASTRQDEHRRSSESSTTRTAQEKSKTNSSSAAMRRASSSGTTHEVSSGSEAQSGISVSPR